MRTIQNGPVVNLQYLPVERLLVGSSIFNKLGSTVNPMPLVNTETHLNSMKGRLFAGSQPIGDDVWRSLRLPDEDMGDIAINELRMVISVFEYLNAEFVNRHLLTTHGGVQYEFGIFQTAVNKVYGQRDFNAPRLWRNFMQNFMSRMAQWVSTWVNTRIDELLVTWRQVQNAAASGSNAHNIATTYITQLEQLREQVRIRAVFDASAFIYMGGTGS
ncbi:hypothetical protein N7509_001248 [Penicillium cosmopolitanum]|uniref:Uncharacterized protein n=1 Tax=Penicillium cosmopolitanum TaxID=1131564 RepID=A0A9W9WBU9_9EURO|nr:uncharacterized protein N7509_001248 [Penicillium cosmopolitanum]KAJ5414621.1 hypothetical protein N7509_001248 [Penicillium cosmopolitanum]